MTDRKRNEVGLQSSIAALSIGKCIPSCVVVENRPVRPDEKVRNRLRRQRKGLSHMDLRFDFEAGAEIRPINLGC